MAALSATARDGPSFSLRYLTGVNMITLGTELCASAAFSYLPPLLLEAGFSESGMSTVMATGPFLALFLLPVMGMASDQCRSQYGRRRPFIFVLALGIILSLILIPNTKTLTKRFSDYIYIPDGRFGMLVLAAGVILLDFCSQVCYTPIESLLSDPCKTEAQRNRSFSNFSLMMSTGACLGYWVVSVDWSETVLGKHFGGHERTLFIILLILFMISLLISLLTAFDPPLDSLPIENASEALLSSHQTHPLNGTLPLLTPHANGGTIKSEAITPKTPGQPNLLHRFAKRFVSPLRVRCSALVLCMPCPKINIGPIVDTVQGIRTMPRAMRTLWVAHLMTSTAVMGFRLYFTDYMGESIYRGNPDSPAGSLSKAAYEQGIRTGSFGLLMHSILSAMFSIFISTVITAWGPVPTYMFGMVTFTLSTFLMFMVDGIALTLVFASFTGFANATITTVPYTLLTSYHEKKQHYFGDSATSDNDVHGKGADIALLDSAYILSEVISSFAFGVIVELTKTTGAYIACSFFFGLLSCFFVLRIK